MADDENPELVQRFSTDAESGSIGLNFPGQHARVHTASSAELEDWTGVMADLESCIEYCEAALQSMVPDEPPTIGERALGVAALVAFARCFTTGVRAARLDESALDDLQLSELRRLLDLRNKHVTHSVNMHEQNVAFVVLAEPPAQRAVDHVLHLSMSSDPLNVEGVNNLCALARVLAAQASARCAELLAKVREEVSALDVHSLYALDPLQIDLPTANTVGRSRRPGRPKPPTPAD